MNLYSVIRKPLITEKSTLSRDERNQYIFEVDKRANKIEITQAVEKIFKVKVLNVRTLNMSGKKKRVGKTLGQKSDWKKAIVTLAEGNTIEMFEKVLRARRWGLKNINRHRPAEDSRADLLTRKLQPIHRKNLCSRP